MIIRWPNLVLAVVTGLLLSMPLAAETSATGDLKFGNLPLVFEPNRGQTAAPVRFVSRGNRYSLFLTETEALISLSGEKPAAVRMQLVGQNPHPQIAGGNPQPGTSQYIKGSAASQWHGEVPHYLKVDYRSVYPGIDLTYYGNQRQLEYDFTVAPHANPKKIQLKFTGAERIEINAAGDLVLHTAAGDLRHERPYVYQMRDGRPQAVAGAFALLNDGVVGFRIGKYDESSPLIIDPKFLYATYFGGAGNNGDIGIDLKVDALGTTYVTGYTSSMDFFATNLSSSSAGGNLDAYVMKVNAAGTTVLSAMYFGGAGDDEGHRIALDDLGNIYITGFTSSADFPIVNGFQVKLAGRKDAYIAKINNAVTQILFSSYIGGSLDDQPFGLSVDSAHNIYIAGETLSNNFPLVKPVDNRFAGGLADGFVAKLAPDGTLIYSTYLGGKGNDRAYDVTSDASGNAFITGFTSSSDFPVINAVFPAFQGGTEDAFVTKLSPDGGTFLISTFLGGFGTDEAVRIAIDPFGGIVIAGFTNSPNFPLQNAVQGFLAGGMDIFVTRFVPDLTAAIYSTYIGSDGSESAPGLAVDAAGNVYIAGFTSSFTFPVVNGIEVGLGGGTLKGDRDAYITKLSLTGRIQFSTYIGGTNSDGAVAIALDSAGDIYMTGYTFSSDFPVVNAFQPTIASAAADGFLLKINDDDVVVSSTMTIPSNGGVELDTLGASNQVGFGHARFDVPAGAKRPAGMVILDLRQRGAEVGEVALPLLPFITDARVYVNESSIANTNIAIANPSDQPVMLYWFMTDRTGAQSNYGGLEIPPKASFAQPVTNNPFLLPANAAGTLTFSTTAPVAATAFRTFTESNGSILLTYLPLVDPYHFETQSTTIAQYAVDLTWSSEFHLVNNTETTMTGVVRFFNNGPNEGDPTQSSAPISLALDRGNFTDVPYNLPPRASDNFATSSTADTVSGYAQILPDAGTFTPVGYLILTYSQNSIVSLHATVEAQVPKNDFRFYDELSGDFDNGEGHATAMAYALSNPASTPTTVTMTLVKMDGTPTGLSATFTLPPQGHIAAYLHRMNEFQNMPKPFQGMVLVHATGAGVVSFAMRGRISESAAFVGTTTGPLKENPGGGTTVIFPHFLDGGGYGAQFLLFSDPSGAGTSGALSFHDENGENLPLTIK